MARPLTRRDLLRRGGTRLAGAAALGSAAPALLRTPAADAAAAAQPKNVLLIVTDRMRSDFVGAYAGDYDDTTPAKTPNLDALANRSLRFKHSVPEAMPAVPMRNGLLTGMRSYPFRDWRATAGLPAIPGWNGIYDYQPLLPELLQSHGVHTVWVTDNPLLTGARSKPWVRTTRTLPTSASHPTTIRSYFEPLQRGTARVEPSASVFDEGLKVLDEVKREQPFFVALDVFDPDELFAQPIAYASGPLAARQDLTTIIPAVYTYGQYVEVDATAATRDEVRSLYAKELATVDAGIGRVLNKLHDAGLADSTMVIVTSDSGIALGEQGVFGYPTQIYHRRVFEVPFLIHDPQGHRDGDESNWYASSHDIAPTVLSRMGITIPGRMAGEDLNVYLRGGDEDHLPSRPYFTTALDTQYIVGDQTYLLRGSVVRSHRALYYTKHKDNPEEIENKSIKRPAVLEDLWREALNAAGGTLPDFGATAAIRPNRERNDDQIPQDGTLTNRDEEDAQRLSNTGAG